MTNPRRIMRFDSAFETQQRACLTRISKICFGVSGIVPSGSEVSHVMNTATVGKVKICALL